MSAVGSSISSASSAEQICCADCGLCKKAAKEDESKERAVSLMGLPTKMIRFDSKWCIKSVTCAKHSTRRRVSGRDLGRALL
jgi:hypothetical protein